MISAVEWVPVESGLFSAAAYRASARQLYLRFQDGRIYRFFDCPVTVHDEFMAAASQGGVMLGSGERYELGFAYVVNMYAFRPLNAVR